MYNNSIKNCCIEHQYLQTLTFSAVEYQTSKFLEDQPDKIWKSRAKSKGFDA